MVRFSTIDLLKTTTLLAIVLALFVAPSWDLKLLGFPVAGAALFGLFGRPWRGAVIGLALPYVYSAAIVMLLFALINPRAGVVVLFALAVLTPDLYGPSFVGLPRPLPSERGAILWATIAIGFAEAGR